MALGTAQNNRSQGEFINHFTGVRIRVNGTGNLLLTLKSLDDARTQTLVPLVLSSAPGKSLFRLANFMEERAYLELKTTEINETFKINRIIIFARPTFTSYPA